jgi:Rod binding domain-containing protein
MEVPQLRSLTVAAQNEAAHPDRRDESAKIREAAAQFEALLLAQVLKSVNEAASEGWLGTGQDEAGGLMLEVAQEHLAQVMASQGGLGLAKLVVEGLSRKP